MTSLFSGASLRTRQRERIVGSSRSGAWLTSRKTLCGGGSSRFLSKALAALRSRSSAASITTARQGDMDDVVVNNRCSPLTWSTVIDRAKSLPFSLVSRSSRARSGWLPASTSFAAGCASATSSPSSPGGEADA
jgi:hypothetical protein